MIIDCDKEKNNKIDECNKVCKDPIIYERGYLDAYCLREDIGKIMIYIKGASFAKGETLEDAIEHLNLRTHNNLITEDGKERPVVKNDINIMDEICVYRIVDDNSASLFFKGFVEWIKKILT